MDNIRNQDNSDKSDISNNGDSDDKGDSRGKVTAQSLTWRHILALAIVAAMVVVVVVETGSTEVLVIALPMLGWLSTGRVRDGS
ncbi:hypothetical protein IN07_03735 [Modestobacter caceresii]|uniref:Uncharacterized protein n=1 Tax=Modestobacter caceresii TaxID=1522368 RepID=A0A098YBG6_9ACTN|nr:hypothetical protein [Modestobacter caceresii]KGH48173.1 hypothetical protein IN07_03735 [Modestobacter caceresii]